MTSFELKLFSSKQSKIMRLESAQNIDQNIVELLTNFTYVVDEVNCTITVENLQRKTLYIQKNIDSFVTLYKDAAPQLNKLKSFMDSLKDGEYFYIFPNSQLETIQIADLSNKLHSLNEGLDLNVIQDQFTSIFGDLLTNYNMYEFNGKSRIAIGNSDKLTAICRFCEKSSPNTTFNKKAHAISEALGNKGIVCNEECDVCNAKFGDDIETDLIAFLSLYRSFFGIKGKNSGTPKIKGKNFSIKKNETEGVNFTIKSEGVGMPNNVKAITYEKISQQNIYRTLCKYALSVISSEHVPSFKKCINWINGSISPNKLPYIFSKTINEFYSEHPSLVLYIRKSLNENLPHLIGEFRFTNMVIVFPVPFSDKDKLDFINESDFNSFWELSHFSKHAPNTGWSKIRLDSDEKRELQFSINFEQRV